MFSAKIISSEKYNETTTIRNVLYAVFIIGFILMKFLNSKRLKKIAIQFETILFYLFIFWIIAALGLCILYFYSRSVKKVGVLKLDNSTVTIQTNKKTVYSINQISDIKIIHNSFVGDDCKDDPATNFKGNNYIEFFFNQVNYKYEFMIDSHYLNNQLKKVVDYWSGAKISFTYEQI